MLVSIALMDLISSESRLKLKRKYKICVKNEPSGYGIHNSRKNIFYAFEFLYLFADICTPIEII
jgi:hypothetical protein